MKPVCARCAAPGAEEYCWYCLGRLCSKCWEEFGHCGEPEAIEANRTARERGGADDLRATHSPSP